MKTGLLRNDANRMIPGKNKITNAPALAGLIPNNMMKKLTLLSVLMLMAVVSLFAQVPGPITTAGQQILPTSAVSVPVTVPVTVDNFSNVTSLSLTINFDPAILQFTSETHHASLTGMVNLGIDNINGVLILGWFGSNIPSISNGAHLFDLNFLYTGTGTSLITFSDPTGIECEYTDNTLPFALPYLDAPKDTYYKAGFVTDLAATAVYTNQCLPGNVGVITVTATGGSGSYEYSIDGGATWVPGASPYSFTGLAPGAYVVKVRDMFLATPLATITVGTLAIPVHNVTQNTYYCTIQAAVNAANTNDLIQASPWTYVENVTVNKSVTITGLNTSTTFIDGNGSGTVVNITANNVVFEGFTVQNSGNVAGDAGILIGSGVTGAQVQYNLVTGNENGISLINANGNTIQLNEVTANNNGFYIGTAFNTNTLFKNKIYGNTMGMVASLVNPLEQVAASLNWWGDATGPYNNPYNTCGLGNGVTGNVIFQPWYTTVGMTTTATLPVKNFTDGTYYCTIQDAVNDASNNDVIHLLATGSYGSLVYNYPMNIEIKNMSSGTATMVGTGSALTVSTGTLKLDGIDLTTAANFPTIDVSAGKLIIRNCNVFESTGFDQNGILVSGGELDAGTSAVDYGHNRILSDGPMGAGHSINNTGGVVNAIANHWGSNFYSYVYAEILGTVPFDPWCNYDFTFCGLSRFGGPITYAPKIITTSPQAVTILVTVDQFANVDAISLTLDFDPTVLQFTGFTPNAVFPGMSVLNPTSGQLVIGWFNSIPVTTLADGSTVVALNFNFLGGTSLLLWNDLNAIDCEYQNALIQYPYIDQPQATFYHDGWITDLDAASVSSTNVICKGTASGTITVNGATGGSGTYEYSVDGGFTWQASNFFYLPFGTYNVWVRDAAFPFIKIQVAPAVVILEPAVALSATANWTKRVRCKGESNGKAMAYPVGGWGSYTYLWSDPAAQTTQEAVGLAAGLYYVTITDMGGCSVVASTYVIEPVTAFTASAVQSQVVSCKGGSNGSITVTASHGWGYYMYSIDNITYYNYLTTNTITGLPAGNYTVHIFDDERCELWLPVTIQEPAIALSATAAETKSVSCFGFSDGEATVYPVGGWGSYQFSLDGTNYQVYTGNVITGLAAGTYTVYVKDLNNCVVTTSVTITEPSMLSGVLSGNNTICAGEPSTVTVSLAGGTQPYSFVLTDGTNFHSVPSFSGSVYTFTQNYTANTTWSWVSLTDANACASTTSGTAVITVNPLPVVTDVTLLTSVDNTNWSTVGGSFASGYVMCIDPLTPFHYLDINSLVLANVPLSTSGFTQNGFYLNIGSVPAGFYPYWASKGVDGINNVQGWELQMWQIIKGWAPMFYIKYDGSDHTLIDGLQYQLGAVTNPLRISGNYPQGNYIFSGTVLDQNGCTSLPFSINMQLNSNPVVTDVTLQSSVNQTTWSSVGGSFTGGYVMCVDPAMQYHYLDINTMTVGVNSLMTGSFTQNAFYLDITALPAGFASYWSAKGVVSGATGWQGIMYDIITGINPMFYIQYNGTDYTLVDGLQYQYGAVVNPLRISGDYPQGNYKFNGSVVDVNGCISAPFSIQMQLNSSPVVTDVTLRESENLVNWSTVSGTFTGGYEMCLDAMSNYHYLDINTLTSGVNPLMPNAFVQNPFYLDITSVPGGFTAYWAAKGVVFGATGWQGVMWNIINGVAPMFYINYDGSDYTLVDGLQYQYASVVQPLRISGDYPQSAYIFTGSVVDINGCSSSPFSIEMFLHQKPMISFGFNGIEAGHNASFEYCYNEPVGVTLFANYSGTAPFSVTYTINGGTPVTVNNLNVGDPIIAPQLYVAGTYNVVVTNITDALGCQASTAFLAYCTATITINAEPMVSFGFNGVEAGWNASFAYCYDVPVGVNLYASYGGIAPYSVTYTVNGGTPVTVNNLMPGDPIIAAQTYPAGVYNIVVTNITDAKGCQAGQTFLSYCIATLTIYAEPMISFGFNGVEAGWNASFAYCYNEAIGVNLYAYYGGTAPYSVTYTVNGGSPVTVNNLYVGDPIIASQIYAAGTYNVVVTNISDAKGCQASLAFLANCTATITVNPEPAVGFSFNGVLAGTGSSFNYCYTTPVTVTLSDIWSGTAPFNVSWTVDNGSGPVAASLNGVALGGTLFSNTLAPGTYTIQITGIVDAKGCSPSSYAPYIAYVTIHSYKISGYYNYHNAAETALNNIIVTLKQGMTTIATTPSATDGYYEFTGVCPGTYEVVSTTVKPAGGINSTDAVQVNGWGLVQTPIEKVRFMAGDAVGNNSLNSADAGRILQYFVTSGTPPFSGPLWAFWKAGDIISGNPFTDGLYPVINVTTADVAQNFYGMATGDFNRSFTPNNAKSSGSVSLNAKGSVQAAIGTEFELPVFAGEDMDVSAISLVMNYPADKVELTAVTLGDASGNPVMFSAENGILRIAYASLNPLVLTEGQQLVTLKLRALPAFVAGESVALTLDTDPLNELAGSDYQPMNSANLWIATIEGTVGVNELPTAGKITLGSMPNPFRDMTTLRFSVPETGYATLDVYDLVGRKVISLYDGELLAGNHTVDLSGQQINPGVYLVSLRFGSGASTEVRTIRIVKN